MKQEKFIDNRIYHVFNRGNNVENIFIEEKNFYFQFNRKVSDIVDHKFAFAKKQKVFIV